MREEIPINENMGEEIINEIEEELLDEEGSEGSEGSESSELSEDIDDEKAIIRLGDEYIVLLESREKPFLMKIVEILTDENRIKCEDENQKILIFEIEYNEIIRETDDYKIIDILRVRLFKPEKEDDPEYEEIEIEVEELIEKRYSDIAKKDDLLSILIQSMNIYENTLLIDKVQKSIDNFIEMISELSEEKEEKLEIESWLIPIIEDNLKLYDEKDELLKEELIDEYLSLNDKIENYREYINKSLYLTF